MTSKKPSFCRTCHNCCAVIVEVDEAGHAVSMTGDRENPLFEGYTCVKGRSTPEMHKDPNRLLHSSKRMPDGSYVPIGVEQAMDEIAVVLDRLIDEHGPRAVSSYMGTAAAAVSMAITPSVIHGFCKAIGTPMAFDTLSIDQPGKLVAKGFHGDWMAPTTGKFDPEVMLAVGLNPVASHSGFPTGNPGGWLTKQLARGMQLIVIDPRRTDIGRRATLFLQPKPGHDPAILASLIHVILEEELYDREFVAENAAGVEQLRAAVAPFTPGEVAQIADVDAEDLVRAARIYAGTRRALAACGTGPSLNGHSTLVEYLRMNLMTLCGHWQREGELIQNAGVACPPRHAKAQAMPPSPAYGFGEPMRVRGLSGSMSGLPTAAAADEILLPGEGQVRALISCAGNPVAAWPDQLRTIRAMQELELLVSLEIQNTQTTRLSHYVIATPMSLEIPGVTYFAEIFDGLAPHYGLNTSYGQYAPRVVEPPEGSDLIEDWEFYYGVAKRLGLPLEMVSLFNQVAEPYAFDMEHKPTTEDLYEVHMSTARIPLDELKLHPHGAFFPSDLHVAPKDEGWEGRLDLANGEMLADLKAFEPDSTTSDDEPEYPFRLISRRMKDVYNSAISQHATLRGRMHNPAYIHPADLERLGVVSGDVIEIRSQHATILGIATEDPTVREGLVSMSHCFGGQPDDDDDVLAIGSPVGRLCSVEDNFERYSGIPRMSNIPVVLTPASVSREPVAATAGA